MIELERNKCAVLLTLAETNPQNPGYNQIVATYTKQKCLGFYAPNTRQAIILSPELVDRFKDFVKAISGSTPANSLILGHVSITYTEEKCLGFYGWQSNQLIILHPEQVDQFKVFLSEIEGLQREDVLVPVMAGRQRRERGA